MPRGRRSQLRIELTEDHRRQLEAWQRSTTIPAGLARRGRIILLLADGIPVSHVSLRVGMERRHVYKWAGRFLAHSLDGLRDSRRDGDGRGARVSGPAPTPRPAPLCAG